MEENNILNVDSNPGVIAGSIDNVNVNVNTYITPGYIDESVLADFILDIICNSSNKKTVVKKDDTLIYDISNKISYNNVIKYSDIINKYYTYSTICEKTLNILDNSKPGAKEELLSFINDVYLEAKGECKLKCSSANLSCIEIIRSNSDHIIDNILEKLNTNAQVMSKLKKITVEKIQSNIKALVIFCFVECKILEKPKVI